MMINRRVMPYLYLLLIAVVAVGARGGNRQLTQEVREHRSPLWCTMKNGERCDAALEAALLQVQDQLADKYHESTGPSGSVASNFRLLVPVALPLSPATQEDLELDRLEQELAQYIQTLEQNKHDLDSTSNTFHSHDTQLQDAGDRWMKINWQGVDNHHNSRESHEQNQLQDQNKRWHGQNNLFGPGLKERNKGNAKLNEDALFVNGHHKVSQGDRVKLFWPYKDDQYDFFRPKSKGQNKGNAKLNDDALFVNGQHKINQGDRVKLFKSYKGDQYDFFRPRSKGQNKGNAKLNDDALFVNGHHKVSQSDRVNLFRPYKDDQYDLFRPRSKGQNKGNDKFNNDALFINGHKDMKLFGNSLHEHDNLALYDNKLHDDEFVIEKGEMPRHTLNDAEKGLLADGPFSEIPSSEFVPSQQSSVKNDLSERVPWLGSVCHSMENNRDEREEQTCGLCCLLHAELVRRGVTVPRIAPAAADLTRPASDRDTESSLEELLQVLGRVLESRRSLHVINNNNTNPSLVSAA